MKRPSTKRIGEVAKVKGGKRLPKGMEVQDDETAHPYLRVVDFCPDGIDRSNIKYITNEVFEYVKRYTINSDDIYVSIAGTIGRVGIVPENLSGANLTENAAKLTKISHEVDKQYLLHFLRSSQGQGDLQNKAGGTSQPKLALFRIEEVEFPCPPIPQQQRIAAILTTYDDLIENNRRRMALLEEAARQVYQEWFVRLRFPGCEHARIVDGVPEGWVRMPLESALVLQRGFDLPSQDRLDGSVPIYSSTGVNGRHNVAKAKAPGVVTGRSGSLGMVHYVHEDYWPLNTTLWVKEFRRVSPLFAFFLLSALRLDQYNGGVSVPTLDRKVVHKIEVVVPSNKTQALFNDYVMPMFTQRRNLGIYNDKLRIARDLLLPKLMSGEIAV